MLLQRKNPQSVETFPIMPRNAFKAPKTKRSPAKQETELYASSSKKKRTKDDFYTFCTIVLSYTQYESLKREELRQQNNISPVGSGGSAADSYSSDSTASLSSGSLQECLQDSLQDGLPVDRVQQPTQDTTPTAISSSSNQLNERVTTTPHQAPKPQQFLKQQQQQQIPKHQQQTLKPPQQPLQQSKPPQQQPNLKQSPLSKNQLSVYDVKHKQPKQQQQPPPPPQPKQSPPQPQPPQQTSPKHQPPQIKQELSVSAPSTPLSVTPTSTSMTQLQHPNTTNRVESKISPKVIKLEPSTYSPQEQSLHQEQLPEEKKPNRFELLQRPKQEENHLSTAGKQKIHIKKEVVEDEEIMKDKENEISKVSSPERRVNAVRKANLRYSKLEMNSSHENAESNTDSCNDSIHSNCSSSPDVNETDEESWDLITCHCLKPYAGRPMIECSECSTWIHLSCAKIRKSNIPETFVCQQCREAKFTTRKSNRIRTESKRISI